MSESVVAPDPEEILAALDPEQRAVATAPLGPMVVLAGAGTGKTRAITHRVAYAVHTGVLSPTQTLAVTFTARAAGEMRSRLRVLGVEGAQARTFHAAALRQLHYFWPQAIGGGAPQVLSQKAPVVAEALGRLRLEVDRTVLRDVAAEIEWAKVSMLTAEGYAAGARAARREAPGMDHSAMAKVLDAYESCKADRGVIDFEDVLLLTVGILEDREDIAAAVRRQYRAFVVDEYQDVSTLQQRLLDAWLGGRRDVCVVGDPAQTIYSFTGASDRHLLGFSARYPGASTVRLVRNYRSTPEVLEVANRVVSGPTATARGAVRLVAQRAAGPLPTLREYEDDAAEAQAVARSIRDRLDTGASAGDIAVLVRTNGQTEVLESALAEEGVPYLIRGGERFFNRAEVRQALVLLRGAARTDAGDVALPDLVGAVLAGAGWSPSAPGVRGAARERWESLSAIVALADELAGTRPEAGLVEFVAELDERAAAQHAPAAAGVTLASLHAAKGLEWDHVHVVGCSEGLIPISLADTPAGVEEERRLLYVGITRARRTLDLSYALGRGSSRGGRRLSRFLVGLDGALDSPVPVPRARHAASGVRRGPRSKGSGRRRAPVPPCRVCGATLTTSAARTLGRCETCAATADPSLVDALRTWRTQRAARDKVPAYIVLTDVTLTALAERSPRNTDDLLAIPGIAERKVEAYGTEILALIADEASRP
ncbi:AAA family ATPase [Nostocoides sp. F2B08]|uniref:ATP-dependent DNA helicase UvrD2 n=1 Tax=Nostocoides sp. F2B08 TaxID=2653936 RepID=UPI00126314DC|nr:ATP-dependent DNA helicase UvrD2 [Tetrasphaera sp. F2B08]KAB7746212.1 AAA family ATPase [Tetrasphaera sp. F2B08]